MPSVAAPLTRFRPAGPGLTSRVHCRNYPDTGRIPGSKREPASSHPPGRIVPDGMGATRHGGVGVRYVHGLTFMIVIATACGPAGSSGRSGKLTVVTGLPPYADLISRIAGDRADVSFIVPPGADPHTYEPLPQDMRLTSDADLYLAAGLPFEDAWLPRIQGSAPGLRVVSLIRGIRLLGEPGHGEQGPEAEPGNDPHTWMSPGLMAIEARNAEAALVSVDHGDSAGFASRLDTLLAEISALQAELHSELDSLRGSVFLVVHPSYGYFADEFGLRQVAIEVNGSEPSPSELAAFVDEARASGARFIIASPQFSTRSAETVASELGIPLILHDPLARDWMSSLRRLGRDLSGSGGG
jgi:zinc transport system substrate-binding protein